MAGIVLLEDVKTAAGITDAKWDVWLDGAIRAVTEAIEHVTGHWFVTRGQATYYFDASGCRDELKVPQGVSGLTYLGVADTDQPDDGTGTYTEITTGVYLDPPLQERREGEPATRIVLGRTASRMFPATEVKRAIKATATWGGWTSSRVQQIATNAIIRAHRARSSGGADFAIVGPDGGMKILRDFAPAELAELEQRYSEVHVG